MTMYVRRLVELGDVSGDLQKDQRLIEILDNYIKRFKKEYICPLTRMRLDLTNSYEK